MSRKRRRHVGTADRIIANDRFLIVARHKEVITSKYGTSLADRQIKKFKLS